jgi:hypothetical protein
MKQPHKGLASPFISAQGFADSLQEWRGRAEEKRSSVAAAI